MDNDVLKLFQWDNSLQAIKQLEDMLLCSICKAVAEDAKCLGRCEHFFCSKCVTTVENGTCPACSIPAPPCEMQPDRIIANLVSSVKDLRHLLSGGEIDWVVQGIEAPTESRTPKSQMKTLPCTPKSQIRASEPTDLIFKHKRSRSLDKISAKESNVSKRKSNPVKSKKELNTSKAKDKPKAYPRQSSAKSSNKSPSSDSSLSKSSLKMNNEIKAVPLTPNGKRLSATMNLSALGMSPGGPSINKRNAKGETMLHVACIKSNIDKVKSLLAEGANPNSKDNAGWTPLHEACSHGFYSIAELLLQHGAFVDVPGGGSDENPLHDAVTQGQIELVKLLRCWGASDTARNLHGQTPRSIASLCVGAEELHSALDTPVDPSLKKPPFMPPYLERMVLLGSGLSASHIKTLDNLAKMLRARVTADFSPDVTHVVAVCNPDNIIIHKTPNYMMGLASGKWILSHKWMEECLSQGNVISPEHFEVSGSISDEDRDAPTRARLNASLMRPGLLRGSRFYLWGTFREPYQNKKVLESLIKAGDGMVLAREPNPEAQDNIRSVPYHAESGSVLANCSYIILYQDGPVEPQIKYNMEHIKTLPLSWFLDCVQTFVLTDPVN